MKQKLLSALVLVIVAGVFVVATPAKVKDRWAKFDGGRIHYYDVGSGKNRKALVLVHGWTCNADFWKDNYEAFPEYRVIAVDLPGHGQSDKPKTNYSMEYFARSIAAVMDEAKIQKAVFVGHSMGTPVMRQFYRLNPDRTIALVIVDGALRPFGPKAQVEGFFAPLFANYTQQGPIFVDGLLGPTRADLKPAIRAVMVAAPEHVAISAMKGMLDDAIWVDDKINVPVLAILADGPNWPKDIETTYRGIAPALEFHRWTGVSHFLMMEKPREFNAAVMAFIKKNKLL